MPSTRSRSRRLAAVHLSSTVIVASALLGGCGPGSDEDRASAPQVRGERPWNVLILMLDTLRADRLASYGYERPLTPSIDRLAREGVRFAHFYSNSSWTLPAHASLFTGLYPMAHRATQETLRLPEGPATMAELFSKAGYATFAASSNGVVSRRTGLARGFETFVEVFRKRARWWNGSWGGHPNNVAFERFLDDEAGERPFFAFLNYIEAHLPYDPPVDARRRWVSDEFDPREVEAATSLRGKDHYLSPSGLSDRQLAILSDLYDAEIAHLDRQIGDLLNMLDARGLLGETLVILTSDHGEHLGEHGHLAHVFSIYNTLLHVPLIVRFPDGTGASTVREDVAQGVDLYPTILHQAGLAAPGPGHGRDLFAPDAAEVRHPALAEYYYPRQVLSVYDSEELERHGERLVPYMQRFRAIQDDRFKLIWGSAGDTTFYDLSVDAQEEHPLSEEGPWREQRMSLLGELGHRVDALQGVPPLPPVPPVGSLLPGFEANPDDPELLEQLRALGYVN